MLKTGVGGHDDLVAPHRQNHTEQHQRDDECAQRNALNATQQALACRISAAYPAPGVNARIVVIVEGIRALDGKRPAVKRRANRIRDRFGQPGKRQSAGIARPVNQARGLKLPVPQRYFNRIDQDLNDSLATILCVLGFVSHEV